MSNNKWNNFFTALVEVCEAYSEAKEKADAKKAEMDLLEDIFGETAVDRSEVIAEMINQGWTAYKINDVLPQVTTPEKAKIAVHMIKNGYRYYDIRDTLKKF